jgi:hypothetical protein
MSNYINCDHHTYHFMPDVITAQGIRYGKTGWQWDGQIKPRGVELNGITRYTNNVDEMPSYIRDEYLDHLIERRPSGGGVFA